MTRDKKKKNIAWKNKRILYRGKRKRGLNRKRYEIINELDYEYYTVLASKPRDGDDKTRKIKR